MSVEVSFVFNAACCKILTGLFRSVVLFTFWSPTFEALIPFAILSSVTAAAAILEVVIANDATSGLCAVPAKSPLSWTTPLVADVASTTFALLIVAALTATTESTYCFTAFADGYFVSEFPSTMIILLLFAIDSLVFIRFDMANVSRLFNFILILFDNEVVSVNSLFRA